MAVLVLFSDDATIRAELAYFASVPVDDISLVGSAAYYAPYRPADSDLDSTIKGGCEHVRKLAERLPGAVLVEPTLLQRRLAQHRDQLRETLPRMAAIAQVCVNSPTPKMTTTTPNAATNSRRFAVDALDVANAISEHETFVKTAVLRVTSSTRPLESTELKICVALLENVRARKAIMQSAAEVFGAI